MAKKSDKYKVLPGGLVIVNPLQNYHTPKIYKEIVNNAFNVDMCEDKQQAQMIFEQLQSEPQNISDFIEQYSHHNQIAWAQQLKDANDNSCKQCTVTLCTKTSDVYTVCVNREFCESGDLKNKCTIMLRPTNGDGGKCYYGLVNYIDKQNRLVYIKLSDGDNRPSSNKFYEAIILPSTLTFYSRCRTLDTIGLYNAWKEYIFPAKRNAFVKYLIPIKDYEFMEHQFLKQNLINRSMNKEQRHAIYSIVSGFHGPLPCILYGPPGTGKTTTLVEAIRLLFDDKVRMYYPTEFSSRVLVCTPSNVAADGFTLNLFETGAFPEHSLLRVYSLSKKVDELNRDLNKNMVCICNGFGSNSDREFGIPSKEELLQKQVIICTLNTATYLINGDMNACFTHIFIDEAGQADVIETLIPIVGLTSPFNLSSSKSTFDYINYCGTRVILAGDPKQLGPVQTCDLLKRYGKNGSLIEELIDDEVEGFTFDKRITTMLRNNYRSHEYLIQVSSILYYGNKLRACASVPTLNESLSQWEQLPKKGFPLFWHCVESTEQIEKNGFSYSNTEEINVVCRYVNTLVARGVNPEDIGVITPYKLQGKFLRGRLSKRYPKMLIDSVERFQGSERRVIIISTVRATGIGFMDDDKRFNTAVTRAKELMIVVGSRINMIRASGWQHLVGYCELNGAIVENELHIVQKQSHKKENGENESIWPEIGNEVEPLNVVDVAKPDDQNNEQRRSQYYILDDFSDDLADYESVSSGNIVVDDDYQDELKALENCMADLDLRKLKLKGSKN